MCIGVQGIPTGLVQKVVDGILQMIMPAICASSERNSRRSLVTSAHNVLQQ